MSTKTKRAAQRFVASGCYAPLRWSAKKPKRRGWWWLLEPDIVGASVRKLDTLRAFGDRLCVFLPLDGWVPIDDCPTKDWWWAGPLPEPLGAPIVKPEHNDVVTRPRPEVPDAN